MTNTALHPSVQQKIRHAMHSWWNRSRFNSDYDPFISSCVCCCSKCEDRLEDA